MKFFGLGIDSQSGCSTNRTQFNQCYNPIVGGAGPTVCNNGTFVMAFNLKVYMIVMMSSEVACHWMVIQQQ